MIYIDGNALVANGTIELANNLRYTPHLEIISFSTIISHYSIDQCLIQDNGALALSSKLCFIPFLTTLYLGNIYILCLLGIAKNRIGDDGMEGISNNLNHIPKLQIIDLCI